MSPSTNQSGGDNTEYATEAARILDEKPKGVVLSIRPQTEELARGWLGEASRLDADQDVVEHFVAEVKRHTSDAE